ncbi:MAG TPA: bifunctional oligoribonuclease/PAP phosphatase NrnA [bacterium]|nr:bifunctional oligoribonuclease/PAP phosphatase NrnA [bacterium]
MTIAETAAFLATGNHFILTSHSMPDADGLGAEYALTRALKTLGKDVRAINADQYTESYSFIDQQHVIESLSTADMDDASIKRSIVVLIDTNDIQYTGDMADAIIMKAVDALIIDHHEVKERIDSRICSVPELSSTCEIAYRILEALSIPVEPDMATALFAGIVFDTGSFAYSKTGTGTFQVALALVEAGASPSAIHRSLYESSSISVLLLNKAVLSTLELHAENRIAIQTMIAETLKETCSSYEDAEGLINVPLQAACIEVSIFFKENEQGTLRCSLRSKGGVNVAQIAQSFGGGGHKSAAGFKSPFPLALIRSRVLELVSAALRS